MYTTTLNTVISSLFLDHHFYADDTQLFLSFHPLNFDWRISHLQNALQQSSSWMNTNPLTLNFPKTEFLLIGLKNQLAKMHNSSLDTSHSAWNLGFILDEHLTFFDQILHLSPRLVTITFVNFAVSGFTSIRQLPAPLLPLSFTPNVYTVILSTINSVSFNYIYSRSRTLLLVLLLKLLSPVISLSSYVLRSLHWLRITERIEYKLLSVIYKGLTTNYPTFMPL